MLPAPRRCQAQAIPSCYGSPRSVPDTSALMILALIALVSLVVSYIGAAVGLVLGQLRLILLVLWLGPLAGAATSLAVSSVGALFGALRHAREGRVRGRLLLSFGLPSALAAFATASLAPSVDPHWLEMAIALTLLASGATMELKRRHSRRSESPTSGSGNSDSQLSDSQPSDSQPSDSQPSDSQLSNSQLSGSQLSGSQRSDPPSSATDNRSTSTDRLYTDKAAIPRRSLPRIALEIAAGGTLGALSGVVGLLLGTLRLPLLLRLLRDPAIAVGSNMAIGALTGALAALAALREGTVDPLAFAVLAPVTMVATHLGARTTGTLRRETLLIMIAWILLLSGAFMLIQIVAGKGA
ncbi:MAG TPA: hypothetical protein ENK31_07810 [Nannocystis exedens]|nr:hypothetical protein [Nannocystis exedens]